MNLRNSTEYSSAVMPPPPTQLSLPTPPVARIEDIRVAIVCAMLRGRTGAGGRVTVFNRCREDSGARSIAWVNARPVPPLCAS